MKSNANFSLLRDLVMVYPIKTKLHTESGIVVTSLSDPNLPIEGVVLAVGPGLLDKQGERVPVPVKIGDRVIFVKSEAKEVKYNGDTLLVLPVTDVLCKVHLA